MAVTPSGWLLLANGISRRTGTPGGAGAAGVPATGETVRAAARETGAIITIEDHWPEGGIGDAVLEALAEEQPHPVVVKLAVRSMPGSGTPAELLSADAEALARLGQEIREDA